MQLSTRTTSYQGDDQRWIGSPHGTDHARSITLSLSTFTKATHFPDDYIRSGMPLGRITTSGLYGPYNDAATDGRQALVGFLFTPIAVAPGSTTDPIAALLEHGRVVEAFLPLPVDAAGKADVAGRITFA